MEDNFMGVMLTIYGLIWGGLLALLVYFAMKRIKAKQNEDFEKRDN